MYYKFLNSRHINSILNEDTLIISSLSYFRSLEVEKIGIADRLEGASELTVRDGLLLRESSPELKEFNRQVWADRHFAGASEGGTIRVGKNVSFISQLEGLFIFSISSGDLSELSVEMCVTSNPPYDACLRLRGPYGLQRRIFDQGHILSIDGNESGCYKGIPVSGIFDKGQIVGVEYESRSRDFKEHQFIQPSPFKKEVVFETQHEERMLFLKKKSCTENFQRVVLKVQNLRDFFTVEFNNYNSFNSTAERPVHLNLNLGWQPFVSAAAIYHRPLSSSD